MPLSDSCSPQLGLPTLPRLVHPVPLVLSLLSRLLAHQAPAQSNDRLRTRLHDAQDLGQLQQLQRVALPHQAAAEAVGRAGVGGGCAREARQGRRGCAVFSRALIPGSAAQWLTRRVEQSLSSSSRRSGQTRTTRARGCTTGGSSAMVRPLSPSRARRLADPRPTQAPSQSCGARSLASRSSSRRSPTADVRPPLPLSSVPPRH